MPGAHARVWDRSRAGLRRGEVKRPMHHLRVGVNICSYLARTVARWRERLRAGGFDTQASWVHWCEPVGRAVQRGRARHTDLTQEQASGQRWWHPASVAAPLSTLCPYPSPLAQAQPFGLHPFPRGWQRGGPQQTPPVTRELTRRALADATTLMFELKSVCVIPMFTFCRPDTRRRRECARRGRGKNEPTAIMIRF